MHSANVCLIGQTVRKELFGAEQAVNRIVRINQKLFRITGVLATKGQSSTGQDQDDTFIMPFTTVQLRRIRKLSAHHGDAGSGYLCGSIVSAGRHGAHSP